jgi:hypothetical protein
VVIPEGLWYQRTKERQSESMKEATDQIIREYIDFVNNQVGVYMDALAGFAGHHTRVELKAQRILRKTNSHLDDKGYPVMVFSSYEDPEHQISLHNRITRASEYLSANSPGGSNEQQHSKAVLLFLFAYWEYEIRPRLASSQNIALSEIRSDVMGDLRRLRNVILHSKSIMRREHYNGLKTLKDMFVIDQPIHLSYERMHRIFVLIKQACSQILLEWLNAADTPFQTQEIADIAFDNTGRVFFRSDKQGTFVLKYSDGH